MVSFSYLSNKEKDIFILILKINYTMKIFKVFEVNFVVVWPAKNLEIKNGELRNIIHVEYFAILSIFYTILLILFDISIYFANF